MPPPPPSAGSGHPPPPGAALPASGSGPIALPPPSPFALARGYDDTGLYQDGRAAFSHLLPGRPRFARSDAAGSGAQPLTTPPADAVLFLEDAPVTLRYRLETPRVAAPTAADVAHLTAVVEVRARAGVHAATATVDHANTTWLTAWGVEGAAIAAYEVGSETGGAAVEREDLFVLVRSGLVLTVRWTYPRDFVSDPAYAMFASVAEATMVWDPLRWQAQQRSRVWPESTLLGPGLRPAPHAALLEHARELARTPLTPPDRERLLAVLSIVVSNAGAPWVPIAAPERTAATSLLTGATADPRLRTFIEHIMSEVRNAHDLRGAALLVARAILDPSSRSSHPPASQAAEPRIPSSLGMPRPNVPPRRTTPPPLPKARRTKSSPKVPPPLPTRPKSS